ncbi:restriction endonuclease subunit S, partial [uncultured Muribaculum sp.]
DALVAGKQAQVEDLRKYRTSLITEAVTRGLNPNAPLRQSGIDLIGDIPQTWECIPLKFLLHEQLMYGANETAEDEINFNHPRYIRITDISENGKLKSETYRTLSPIKAEPYMLKSGDVLFARSGATAGKTYLYNETYPACFAGYLIKASCGNKLLPTFLCYFTNTQPYINWKSSIFDQSTIQNISAEKYNGLPIPLPTMGEQQQIVKYLDEKTAKIDALIDELNQQLDELALYRKAVISEAVTGKVDVRDWKPED